MYKSNVQTTHLIQTFVWNLAFYKANKKTKMYRKMEEKRKSKNQELQGNCEAASVSSPTRQMTNLVRRVKHRLMLIKEHFIKILVQLHSVKLRQT
jgi:hypothetical protein